MAPKGAELRLVVPGGVDPDSGVSTVPVSIVAHLEDGTEQILKDSLLTLRFSDTAVPLAAVQTQAAEPVKHSYGLPAGLALAALAIGAIELVHRKKKQ